MSNWPLPEESNNNPPTIGLDDLDRAPYGLPAPGNVDYAVLYHQVNEKFVKVADENFALKEAVSELRIENNTRALLDELIIPMATKSFFFMCSYCAFVGLALVLHGFQYSGFHLPDTVLDFLVGSTAVTVIGLVGMVLTGVFVGGRKRS